jgi:predicted SAM-dependent methyltransferase
VTVPEPSNEPFRLHLGGVERKEGWKVLNAQPGPHVDFVGACDDLGRFADGSVDEVYASHILEHLSYFDELPRTLHEISRVLKRGGALRVAVPDMDMLARLLMAQGLDISQRFHVMRMIYGGQTDMYDFHRFGFTFELLTVMLSPYHFGQFERVASFGLFKDTSELKMGPYPISLNVKATRLEGVPPKRAQWMPAGFEWKAGVGLVHPDGSAPKG